MHGSDSAASTYARKTPFVPAGPMRTLDRLVWLGLAGASELSRELGITRERTRQHLRTLSRHGLAEVAFTRGGRRGRRERVWRPTAAGQARARPQWGRLLLVTFLRVAARKLGPEAVAELLQEAARQLVKEMRPERATLLGDRVSVLRGLLDELAVASRLEEAAGIYTLHLLTSPSWEATVPEAPTFYRALAEEVLEVEVEAGVHVDIRRGTYFLLFRTTP
ncbi:hypothetical protein ACVNPS_08210 [Candidatus Bipolaricaulota sp. J31]